MVKEPSPAPVAKQVVDDAPRASKFLKTRREEVVKKIEVKPAMRPNFGGISLMKGFNPFKKDKKMGKTLIGTPGRFDIISRRDQSRLNSERSKSKGRQAKKLGRSNDVFKSPPKA